MASSSLPQSAATTEMNHNELQQQIPTMTDSFQDDDLQSNGSPNATTRNGHQHDQRKVIGIQFPNGKIFYLYRSTLMKSSGYFEKIFSCDQGNDDTNSSTVEQVQTRDSMGRNVYFVERDSSLFENHILPFILTRKPGNMPPFSENPTLWRTLRKEADHYDIHGFCEILYVTHLCSPSNALGRGVFYYLGINKGTTNHWNPHALGTIQVSRKVHYMTAQEQTTIFGSNEEDTSFEKVLLQYQPTTPTALDSLNPAWSAVIGLSTPPKSSQSQDCCRLFSYCHGSSNTNTNNNMIPTLVDLRSISLRLVAYSLHKDACGMKQWTLEGSTNGIDWKVLHSAPGKNKPQSNFSLKEKEIIKSQVDMIKTDIMTVPKAPDPLQKVEIVLDQAENSRRRVWEITSPPADFFRFFRIVAVDDTVDTSFEQEEDNDDSHAVLMTKHAFHGVGLELFGEVHED